jgi:hypothetical protein
MEDQDDQCQQVASAQPEQASLHGRSPALPVTVGLSAAMVDQASAAGDNHAANQAKLEGACD